MFGNEVIMPVLMVAAPTLYVLAASTLALLGRLHFVLRREAAIIRTATHSGAIQQ